jgi:hypothetical protein
MTDQYVGSAGQQGRAVGAYTYTCPFQSSATATKENQGISQLNQSSQAWPASQGTILGPVTQSSWIPGTRYLRSS